jgi:hypothetical protein
MSSHSFNLLHGAILHAVRAVTACVEGFALTLPSDRVSGQINEAFGF